ncbi:IS30 family transposase [uncultured Limosilactobacillus sp.]|uniref:IS30 family transposase n=1 Tax=uncultured Limosilactobacillus sp. TaxID=2837629 RepID=UPI0025889607|nr:IS30 family transposase [uncultured Limosilactobacillus sp.]
MGTTILSFSDRVVIETLHNEKRSLQYIADYLGFSKTTIFNELHRLDVAYQAQLAQADFEKKVTQRGRKSSLTTNLKRLIEEKIKVQKWSAEQVAHVVGIAYKSIYNWIDQGLLDLRLKDLPDHGIRRHRAKEKRGTFSHGRSIEERPADVETRQEFGHFEADAVLSGKRKGQAVATFVERKSRLTIVKRLNGRDSISMTKAILELANQLGDNLKTLTVDHGKEFANYNLIEEQTGVPLYFAHAYSPPERGSNENRNRVLRRFIPKGQPIDEITDDELIQINWYLNSRPLKCLNWRTPIESFLRNLRY